MGDFGLAKAQAADDTANSSGVVGTLGYVAPEYAECGKMSDKTDVYSFGVVLLQLITGLRTTDEIPGGKSLVGWVTNLNNSCFAYYILLYKRSCYVSLFYTSHASFFINITGKATS